MMKKGQLIVKNLTTGILVCAMATLFGACLDIFSDINRDPPSGYGRITVNIGDGIDAARTILPETSAPAFTSVKLVFSGGPGGPITVENATGVTGAGYSKDLQAGTWTITASAYVTLTGANEVLAAQGSDTVAISAGASASKNIVVHPVSLDGTKKGVFSHKVTWSGITVNSKTITLTPTVGGAAVYTNTDFTSGAVVTGEVLSGMYDMYVAITDANGKVAGDYRTVHIYPGLTSKVEFTFGAADFVTQKMLAGTTSINANGVTLGTVFVKAYSDAAFTPPIIGSAMVSGTAWAMSVPVSVTDAYFGLEVADGNNSSRTYTSPGGSPAGSALTIPDTGTPGIALSMTINKITLETMSHGSVTPKFGGQTTQGALAGETVTLTVSPAAGYLVKLNSVKYNGTIITTVSGSDYTFTMPAANASITAEFGRPSWYVYQTGGNDSNLGTNSDAPLSTIAKALEKIRASYNPESWPKDSFNNPIPVQILIKGTFIGTGPLTTGGGMVEITGINAYPPIIFYGLSASEQGILDANSLSRVLHITDGNDVTLGVSMTLTGGRNLPGNYLGGGVHVTDASFTMTGGTIKGNQTNSAGGGVYIGGSNGSFTMSGGTIGGPASADANKANEGAGVYIGTGASFTMSGGFIEGNQNTGDHGGGVKITGVDTSFTMSGGSIKNNECVSTHGGGVSVVNSGSFNMTGGSIEGNQVPSGYSGGGVYVSSTFTMSGTASISGNTANLGAGVCIANSPSARFTMNGGTISGNTAKGNNAVGGGVFMYAGVDSIIPGIFKKVTAAGDPSSSGTIYGNTGDANGNKVLNASDAVLNDRGHAVYVGRYDSGNYIVIKKRETTAGPTDSMDSTQTSAAGGWE